MSIVLLFYALLAGLATVLSPCILPVLPIVLSSSIDGDRRRPLGVVAGLIVSFSAATLAVSALVDRLGIPADALRNIGIAIVALAGISLLFPEVLRGVELLLAGIGRLGSRVQGEPRRGFWGGLALGAGLGLVWTPCAGPILATVIALAATNHVSTGAGAVVVAYAIGAGIPMLGIAYGGRLAMQKLRGASKHAGAVQRGFGVIMLLVALGLATGVDRDFQVWASGAFPGGWNTPFSSVENSAGIKAQLADLKGTASKAPPRPSSNAADAAIGLTDAGHAPDFTGISHWFNTAHPLTLAALRGKVVLIDFWTYSCINCLRTLPHIKDWYARYGKSGLVVIGVHSPEFPFEGIASNVAAAIKQWGISYPVALDPKYATWNAYNNQYWPAEYLLDAQGNVRYTSFGEGDYDKTERAFRQLLADAGKQVTVTAGQVPDTTPANVMTPETYVGSERISGFASPEQIVPDAVQTFTTPATLPSDQFALAGSWRVGTGAATALRAGDSLDFTVTASKVFVIFAPRQAADTVRVLLDGKQVVTGKNAGADVRDGKVTVRMDNLYNVVDLGGRGETHRLRLVFETAGTEVYSFTFG
jgi:cytochrome c biogenesis protein CcdA/thiol-disulfide isomerase/thioredoxin